MNLFQKTESTRLAQGHSATGCKQKFWISNAKHRDYPSTDRRRPLYGAWKQPTGEVARPTVVWHCSCSLAGELCLYCMPVIFFVGLGSGHGSLERCSVVIERNFWNLWFLFHKDKLEKQKIVSMVLISWIHGISQIFEQIGQTHIPPVNRTLWMHHGSVSSIIEKSLM